MAVWIVSGLYAFAGANTYAELGTMVPLDGGPYVFARRAYGEFGVAIWTSSQATTADASSTL